MRRVFETILLAVVSSVVLFVLNQIGLQRIFEVTETFLTEYGNHLYYATICIVFGAVFFVFKKLSDRLATKITDDLESYVSDLKYLNSATRQSRTLRRREDQYEAIGRRYRFWLGETNRHVFKSTQLDMAKRYAKFFRDYGLFVGLWFVFKDRRTRSK